MTSAIDLTTAYQTLRGNTEGKFFALEGKEGDRINYTAKLTFKELARLFNVVDNSVFPEGVMLQRQLAKSRSQAIKRYIQQHQDFVFPQVIAIVERVVVNPTSIWGAVIATLPADAFRYLVDGQGRLFAIQSLLEEDASFADHTIDVKFLVTRGVEKDAQVFTDINRTPQAPNASQCLAMDSRDVLSVFTRELVQESTYFRSLVDYHKASVTMSSNDYKIWTLNQVSKFILGLTNNSVKSANERLKDESERQSWKAFTEKFFDALTVNPQIKAALENGRSGVNGTIIGSAVFLKGLALFGRICVMNMMARGDTKHWGFMSGLKAVDFSVDNAEWIGRCLNARGKFEDKSFNHAAIASYLCEATGLSVPEEIEAIEEEVLMARAAIKKQQREAQKQAA